MFGFLETEGYYIWISRFGVAIDKRKFMNCTFFCVYFGDAFVFGVQ